MGDKKFVLVITGPAGAGKSTVAEKPAKQVEPAANIDIENFNRFIPGGFYAEMPEDSKRLRFNKWELAGDSLGLLASNFLKNDHNVVIEGHVNEPLIDNLQRHVTLAHKILLLPSIDAVISRDASRGKAMQMGEAMVRGHYSYFVENDLFDDFVKIDSTDLSVGQTLDKIMEILAS